MKNTVILAGGSGFLGKRIGMSLVSMGFDVVTLSRAAKNSSASSPIQPWQALPDILTSAIAVVNLAGASLGLRRWTAQRRHLILQSRLDSTNFIADELIRYGSNAPALVSVTGTGYYGNTLTPCNEAMGAGQTFLAKVSYQWEQAALQAQGVSRVAVLRLGVVLDSKEGALPRIVLPFRFGVGGPLGSGNQWFPWIHVDDAVNAFTWAVVNDSASGPYNAVAPESITMKTLASELGRALRRPALVPVPSIVLRLLLGRQADMVLHGQKVIPSRLLGEKSFRYAFPLIRSALADIFRRV